MTEDNSSQGHLSRSVAKILHRVTTSCVLSINIFPRKCPMIIVFVGAPIPFGCLPANLNVEVHLDTKDRFSDESGLDCSTNEIRGVKACSYRCEDIVVSSSKFNWIKSNDVV